MMASPDVLGLLNMLSPILWEEGCFHLEKHMEFNDIYTSCLTTVVKKRSDASPDSAAPTGNTLPWAEDCGCVIWDILCQRGCESIRKELGDSQPMQMAAAEGRQGAEPLLGPLSF